MRTSFHYQPEAQHPNFPLSTSRQADYPILRGSKRSCGGHRQRTGSDPERSAEAFKRLAYRP
jgi:hypothetical protein